VNDEYKVSQEVDLIARGELAKKIDYYKDKGVKDVLRKLLFDLIPICYLEGFDKVLNLAKMKKWPTKPKFIFTSNNYDTDEVFKTWTALKVLDGCKYIIGQHGNLSSIGSRTNRLIDQKIPDKFLSWGWSDGRPIVTPAFIFKTSGKIKKRYNKIGGILLTLSHYPHRENFWDASENYIKTFENVKKFIGIIPLKYRRLLTVKLHNNWKDFNWHEKERLEIFKDQIKIEDKNVPIYKLLMKNKLIIHGYESTGILETLSMNIPTLAIWSEGLGSIRNEARPYYEMLYKSGIIHFDTETISKKVQNIFNDVETWWSSDEIQQARKFFCDKFAKDHKAPISKLKSLLS
jgi:putative transferase (TIGR04331 family)